MTRPVALSNAALYAADNARANLILSNPFCILRTVGTGGRVRYERYFTPEELDGIYTPVHRPDSLAEAPLAGRNVVIFVMESMSAEHSAYLHPELYADSEQKGYTPFLDSLMQTGYCFTRMYANGTRSIQALPPCWGRSPRSKPLSCCCRRRSHPRANCPASCATRVTPQPSSAARPPARWASAPTPFGGRRTPLQPRGI